MRIKTTLSVQLAFCTTPHRKQCSVVGECTAILACSCGERVVLFHEGTYAFHSTIGPILKIFTMPRHTFDVLVVGQAGFISIQWVLQLSRRI